MFLLRHSMTDECGVLKNLLMASIATTTVIIVIVAMRPLQITV